MYSNSDFGSKPDDVNAYAASLFYTVDRYASYKKDWGAFYMEGGVIIADRYTTSNAIHQCSKLPRDLWDSYLGWLFQFEYTMLGIPAPDMVIYLNIETDVSQRLMTGRYNGDESRKDIQEGNIAYLEKPKMAAEYCYNKLKWNKIDCCMDGRMRNKEDILNDAEELVRSL